MKADEDDITDMNFHETLKSVNIEAMVNQTRLLRLIINTEKNQRRHCRGLIDYYDIGKIVGGRELVYCVATGYWFEAGTMKAAHIVPKY